MVHLARKKRNGKTYLYLEQRARINGKSRRIWQIYLGLEDKIRETGITIAPKNVEYKTMEFGCSAALYQVARKIDLIGVIDSIAGKERRQNLTFGEYMLINIINRCVNPVSKSQLSTWFERDYLSTVFPVKPGILNAQTCWNHFQLLDADKIARIEVELAKQVLQKYRLDLSCLLFDPTNFYTFIAEHENSQLAKFGHSKESRNNLRTVNVSLLCTLLHGVPLFHHVYEGNVQDAKHFKGIISRITDRFQAIETAIEEIVLLFDKSNHSPGAFTAIDAAGLPFIASLRNSMQKDLLELSSEEFTVIKLPSNGKEVGYYRTRRDIYGQTRCVHVLLDPRKKKKAAALFKAKLQKRLTEIDSFLEKLNIKKWRSKEAVETKLKTLIGKKPFAGVLSARITGRYGKLKVTVHVDEEAKTAHLETLGRSIIFTSLDDWPPVKIIQAFRDKYVVEDAFKQLKNPEFLAIRPMYHRADTCIRAHVFSCILGLLLLSLVRLELRQKSHVMSYGKLLTVLSELRLTQVFTSANSPPLYKLDKHSPLAARIYKKLKLKSLLPH
ncbi:MAG: IS1634 family transposase [Candidatus Hodarchaeales archaeon]